MHYKFLSMSMAYYINMAYYYSILPSVFSLSLRAPSPQGHIFYRHKLALVC